MDVHQGSDERTYVSIRLWDQKKDVFEGGRKRSRRYQSPSIWNEGTKTLKTIKKTPHAASLKKHVTVGFEWLEQLFWSWVTGVKKKIGLDTPKNSKPGAHPGGWTGPRGAARSRTLRGAKNIILRGETKQSKDEMEERIKWRRCA